MSNHRGDLGGKDRKNQSLTRKLETKLMRTDKVVCKIYIYVCSAHSLSTLNLRLFRFTSMKSYLTAGPENHLRILPLDDRSPIWMWHASTKGYPCAESRAGMLEFRKKWLLITKGLNYRFESLSIIIFRFDWGKFYIISRPISFIVILHLPASHIKLVL